ncbi:hypothetical protein D2M30_2758 [Bacillus amyloliquefaciens]|uniref:hypothetical protein n=1 Tax=Bacillus amyloliquefaciens TaxID=1390 RepID=UPI0010C3375F|nr:hypothetical protein [Bacillus amyloliquefaciens]QBG57086.1 hypothetical protein D2M30_2758 [Bacillus amyloliquefaciens]
MDILVKMLKENSEICSEEIEGELTSVNITYNQFRISTTSIGNIKGKKAKELYFDLKNNRNIQISASVCYKSYIK